MPRRRRWTPVRGTGNRVYDPAERLLLRAFDLTARAAFPLWRGLARPPGSIAPDPSALRDVLVLRLDRIGDVLMALPALADLRRALPAARIRLAVGRWSEPVARRAPVDEVLVWSAPWVGRGEEATDGWLGLARQALALRAAPPELALDLQGDVRANLLMALTGAPHRWGYGNTGGARLLTQVLPLDETVSWVEQNRRAVAALAGRAASEPAPDPLDEEDRAYARRLLAGLGLESRHPLVGVHPGGGRPVKQWPAAGWAEVAARLQREFGAAVIVTGSAADRPLAEAVTRSLPERPFDLTGQLTVRQTLALIGGLDLFLSPDTGPMHMAWAVRTPSVSVFGPSDPIRYFSGGESADGAHAVVRRELWCSPCNLIRKPPRECAGPEPPECLRLVSAEEVFTQAARLLRRFSTRAPSPAPGQAP